ncbi:hypothetical protein GCM10022222_16730 [Amycolatopsis ultiminotia]|uniref:HNH endonuclease n=1 Tax=Amycolatopsis ultiminotia TaxID=543629 RepID=A0ABP6VFM9_9PSEU
MLPSWQDRNLGSMKRVALWLVSEVGEGNRFTKEEMRRAFPGVSQIDRRVRDLRGFGWQIDTNREDVTLAAAQQRFVVRGQPVWEKGVTSRPAHAAAIGAGRRREIISRDGNMCRSCGIAPGDSYEDTGAGVQLDVARRKVRLPGGGTEVQLVAECRRCRLGGRDLVAGADNVVEKAGLLSTVDRGVLTSWIEADERELGALERVWAEYRALPADARSSVRSALGLG